MRTIDVSSITDAVKKLCMEANYALEPDMLRAFDRALKIAVGIGARVVALIDIERAARRCLRERSRRESQRHGDGERTHHQ